MNINPKFSVLMANYNNGKYIAEAIESVVNQTFQDWELVIVDDGSTDNSLEIIKPFLKDKRIKLIRHKNNSGCGVAKRACAANASGEIFGILDPDDILSQDAISVITNAYEENSDCGFIYSTHYQCNRDLRVKAVAEWVGELKNGKTNLHIHKTSAFRTFKKAVYNKTAGFDFEQKKAVDKDIIYKLEEVTKSKFINKPLYYYRMHDDGISLGNNINKARLYDFLAKYKAYKRRLNTNIPNLTKQEMSTELLDGFILSMKLKDLNRMKYFLFEAIKICPFNIKGYLIFFYRMIKFIPYRLYKKIKKQKM